MAIHIYPSEDGQFYITITGGNHRVLVDSETIKTKRNIRKTIKALQNADLHKIVDHTAKKLNIKKPK